MSTIRDDIGWMVCHSWDCGDAPGDVAVLNTEKLKDKLERYVEKRERELQIEVEQLRRENAALREQVKPLAKAVQDMKALIDESRGVYGLHRNGDESPWDELTGDGYMSEWLGSLDIALAALSAQEAARG